MSKLTKIILAITLPVLSIVPLYIMLTANFVDNIDLLSDVTLKPYEMIHTIAQHMIFLVSYIFGFIATCYCIAICPANSEENIEPPIYGVTSVLILFIYLLSSVYFILFLFKNVINWNCGIETIAAMFTIILMSLYPKAIYVSLSSKPRL